MARDTRPLRPKELVLSVAEKTSLQPRPRLSPTRPARPQNLPHRHEHEYRRAGALNRFAACDPRFSPHHGQAVRTWRANHPRVIGHFTPVHCAWMHHVEQGFSILHRKRLRIVDVASQDHLRAQIDQCIHAWNQQAHPFNWSTKSVAKVMAAAPAMAA
jgi:hypothetical protein